MEKISVSVFAVGNDYHIMMPANGKTLMTVKIGDKLYGDESNGVLRSNVKIHRVIVPSEVLDNAGEYTVYEEEVIDRRPYFPVMGEKKEYTFKFRPVPSSGEIRAYHIADAHSRIDGPIAAAETFGNIDLLVMNGDIPDHSGSEENFDTIYHIASGVTKGEIPAVFSRGNHDMRGILAECIADYTPNQNGNSYYSFRVGSLWGLVLDCGEDKDDSHPEYNHTVWCGNFRERQSDYIRKIIANKENEYAAEGVEHRVVVVHNPFCCIGRMDDPFLIEVERFAEWTKLIGDNIKPDMMIAGHYHTCEVARNGDNPRDGYLPFTVLFGARPEDDRYIGCGMIFRADRSAIDIQFTDSLGETTQTDTIEL